MSKFTEVQRIMKSIYPEIQITTVGLAPSTLRVSVETSKVEYIKDFYIPNNRTTDEEISLIVRDIIKTHKAQIGGHQRISEFDTIL